MVPFHDVHPDRRGRLVDADRPEAATKKLVESGVGERGICCEVVHGISFKW
jgi:hypothetical protein